MDYLEYFKDLTLDEVSALLNVYFDNTFDLKLQVNSDKLVYEFKFLRKNKKTGSLDLVIVRKNGCFLIYNNLEVEIGDKLKNIINRKIKIKKLKCLIKN